MQLGFGHQAQSVRFCWVYDGKHRVTTSVLVCGKTTSAAHPEDEFSISKKDRVKDDII